MSAVLDTLKYAKRLKEGGFTEQQAEALAVTQIELIGESLATKADIAELRAATKADLKANITDLKVELKADIANIRVDIAKLQTDTWWVRWIITGGVGLYALRSIVEWVR